MNSPRKGSEIGKRLEEGGAKDGRAKHKKASRASTRFSAALSSRKPHGKKMCGAAASSLRAFSPLNLHCAPSTQI